MRSLVTANGYWNRRLDPLDWKRVRESDDRGPWLRAHRTFLDPATLDALEALGDPRGKRLLEIGCGQGHGTLHLVSRGARVTGIDIADRRCSVAAGRLRETGAAVQPVLCAASAERMPFPAESFDLVFCRDVLMYTDPERVLAECHRVLVAGGTAAFVESLEGTPLLRAYRRWTSPPEYRAFTRHLAWTRLRAMETAFRRISIRPHYLLSLAAFFLLFCARSVSLYRACLAVLEPLDRRLLEGFPALAGHAWRASVVYRKSSHVG